MKNKVIDYAVQVFGSMKTALGWLNTENPALDGKKPMDLLDTDRGCEHVLNILARIEHGVVS